MQHFSNIFDCRIMGGQWPLILFCLRNQHHLSDVRKLTIEYPKCNANNLSSTVVLNLGCLIESSSKSKKILIPRPRVLPELRRIEQSNHFYQKEKSEGIYVSLTFQNKGVHLPSDRQDCRSFMNSNLRCGQSVAYFRLTVYNVTQQMWFKGVEACQI